MEWRAIVGNFPPILTDNNRGAWSAPTAISSQNVYGDNVFSAVNSATHTFVITWMDEHTQRPTYVTHVEGNTSTPSYIPNSAAGGNDVFVSYNPAFGFMASWQDHASSFPYYAIYNGETWSSPSAVPSAPAAVNDIFSAANPKIGATMLTWRDIDQAGTPWFAIYDASGWGVADRIFEAPASIDPFPCANSVTGDFLVTWQDYASGTPYYAVYNGGEWSGLEQIPNSSSANGMIYSSVNSCTGNFLVTWTDFVSGNPYYVIYNASAGWTTPQQIPNSNLTSIDTDAFSSYDSQLNAFIVSWQTADNTPYYALLSDPSCVPDSPDTISGKQKKNNFGLMKEYFNRITWQVNSTQDVLGYKLYRDGILIATLDANIYSYDDHNRTRGQSYTYALTSFSLDGESFPVTVSVSP